MSKPQERTGRLFFQGEYFWFNVDRNAPPDCRLLERRIVKFKGGYAEASLCSDRRNPHIYNPSDRRLQRRRAGQSVLVDVVAAGARGRLPAGSARSISNDQLAAANGVAGGRQTIYTLALNWYANRNVRLMLDFLHGDVTKQLGPTNFTDAGSKFSAVAMRTQIAF